MTSGGWFSAALVLFFFGFQNLTVCYLRAIKTTTTILVNINYIECDVDSLFMFWMQVANLKKESEFHWYREDTEIIPDVKPDLGAGVCKLPIKLVITQY